MELSEAAQRGRLDEALAEAVGPERTWERGWVLAAMGRYAEALRVLEEALEGPDRARALGTRASVYRQLALHELGERDDDAGLVVAQDEGVRAGLLVGKVADALGLGLADEWGERLAEARGAVEAHGDLRQRLRLAWVTGEVAMYEGRPAEAAPHFAEAVVRAVERGALRHEAKSHLFLAAAHGAVGNTEAAAGHARSALDLARSCGAKPILWASALVLAEAGERTEEYLALAGHTVQAVLDGLPEDVALAARARPPVNWLLAAPD